MANTFLTTDVVARDASIILADNLVMANLVNRNHESEYASKIGDTVAIKVPPVQTARDFIVDGSVTDNAITESSVDLTLEKQPYVAHTLTSKEKSMEIDDFNEVVVKPAIYAIRDEIDEYLIKVATAGFAPNYANGYGTDPSTVAHLIAGRKVLQDNGAPLQDRVGVLGTTAEASMLQLDQFTSADYEQSPSAIREAVLGRKYGIDFYVDQNASSLDFGDTADATNVDGAVAVGDTTITMDDAAGGSAGTIARGAQFTVAGTATVYTVTADVTASGGKFVVPITPASTAIEADNDAVTWKAEMKENILFCKNAMAGAIVAPAPLAVNSSISFYNGIGIRVSMSSSTSSLSDQIVFDTYLGGQVIQADAGCVVGGA